MKKEKKLNKEILNKEIYCVTEYRGFGIQYTIATFLPYEVAMQMASEEEAASREAGEYFEYGVATYGELFPNRHPRKIKGLVPEYKPNRDIFGNLNSYGKKIKRLKD